MVVLIAPLPNGVMHSTQNTQNRETRIVTLKLDELLHGVEGARTGLIKLDHMTNEELEIVR